MHTYICCVVAVHLWAARDAVKVSALNAIRRCGASCSPLERTVVRVCAQFHFFHFWSFATYSFVVQSEFFHYFLMLAFLWAASDASSALEHTKIHTYIQMYRYMHAGALFVRLK